LTLFSMYAVQDGVEDAADLTRVDEVGE